MLDNPKWHSQQFTQLSVQTRGVKARGHSYSGKFMCRCFNVINEGFHLVFMGMWGCVVALRGMAKPSQFHQPTCFWKWGGEPVYSPYWSGVLRWWQCSSFPALQRITTPRPFSRLVLEIIEASSYWKRDVYNSLWIESVKNEFLFTDWSHITPLDMSGCLEI